MFRLPDLPALTQQSGENMYIALYESIRQSIIHHEMIPDEKLPSKRQLARQLDVSVKTIENAYEQLILEGYLYTREKSGYYVAHLENYRQGGEKSKIVYDSRFKETEYKVNLRANRNPEKDFPANTWCRLMRETLTDDRDHLY